VKDKEHEGEFILKIEKKDGSKEREVFVLDIDIEIIDGEKFALHISKQSNKSKNRLSNILQDTEIVF